MATAATIAGVKRQFTGSRIQTTRLITFDSSYVTGGEVFTAAQFGLSSIRVAINATIITGFAAGFAHVDVLPQTDGTVKLRLRAAAGTEVANAADASTVTARVTVEGLGA